MGCLNGILVRTGEVRIGQVRTGQVRTGQVRTGQVRIGQVRTGQVMTGPKKILELKLFWTQHFFGPKIFLDSKCTGEWSLTLALTQLV